MNLTIQNILKIYSMGKLYTFGCSFTEDYNKSKSYVEYKKYRNNILPDVWPTILAKKLNKDVINFGKGGIGNTQIFIDFCSNCDIITSDDIVIIGWTKITRFRWADKYNWQHLMGSDKDMHSISLTTHNEILVNRTNRLYINEINDYEKIIIELANTKKFKIYFWSSDSDIIYREDKRNDIYILNELKNNFPDFTPYKLINENGEILTIKHETNGLVVDSHLGEKGHLLQAELFYNHIKKYE